MIQQTSLMAYAELLQVGTLGAQISLYLSSLARFGSSGASDREVRDTYLYGWELGTVSARRNDCIDMHLVEDCGTKKSDKTGKKVKVWRVK